MIPYHWSWDFLDECAEGKLSVKLKISSIVMLEYYESEVVTKHVFFVVPSALLYPVTPW
jgi:hypothetical protein